jgi:hypothetical protein
MTDRLASVVSNEIQLVYEVWIKSELFEELEI